MRLASGAARLLANGGWSIEALFAAAVSSDPAMAIGIVLSLASLLAPITYGRAWRKRNSLPVRAP
jgi:hypothetical protein